MIEPATNKKKFIASTNCTEHGGSADVFCLDCKIYICYGCTYKQHKAHTTKEANDVLNNLEVASVTLLNELDTLRHKHKKLCKDVEQQTTSLKKSLDKVIVDCDKLRTSIENRNANELAESVSLETIQIPHHIIDRSNALSLETKLISLITGEGKDTMKELLDDLQSFTGIIPPICIIPRLNKYCETSFNTNCERLRELSHMLLIPNKNKCNDCNAYYYPTYFVNYCTADSTHITCRKCYTTKFLNSSKCGRTPRCFGTIIKYSNV